MNSQRILAMVMAGGKGERLHPLTEHRSKPAVPFGSKYRLIDCVLSNLVNSNITSIYVLTQYKAQSLIQHLGSGWYLHDARGREFIIPVPAQMRTGQEWYQGTADAVRQNINLIDSFKPGLVAVFGADHIYRMDISQMVDFHLQKNASITISAIPMPKETSANLGVLVVDEDRRVQGFQEKPLDPATLPGHPDLILASMGNYLFTTEVLKRILENSLFMNDHDFGRDLFPKISDQEHIFAYDFSQNEVPGRVKGEEKGYWRDVGTLQSYYEANMDFRSVDPIFNLYNKEWPLRTYNSNDPPVKFVFEDPNRIGMATNSVISEGCIISGGKVETSVLGRNIFIHSFSHVRESIIFDRVEIGRHCRVRRAIIDKDVRLSPGTTVGYNSEEDRKRFFIDEASGIVVVPKGTVI